MAVITDPTTFEDHAEPPHVPTAEPAQPAQASRDLAWLLSQAYASMPLFA